jgi:hypothetical protein
MNPKIEIRVDQERGCGWRKEGGLYLISKGLSAPCGRLPIVLDVCPCCSAGIKPTRGWTWIDIDALTNNKPCKLEQADCATCPMAGPLGKIGLLWVGEQFYPTPAHFTAEAAQLGVSRRISRIPNGFKVGETWVAFAHRKAVTDLDNAGHFKPAIFHLFKPTAIEYVCTGQESDEQLDALIRRGITPVKIQRGNELPLTD